MKDSLYITSIGIGLKPDYDLDSMSLMLVFVAAL